MNQVNDEYEDQPTSMVKTGGGKPSRQDSMVVNRAMVAEIVQQGTAGLRCMAKGEKVAWTDTEAIMETTLAYMAECQSLGIVPGMAGLAARLGRSRQALYAYMGRNPNSETTRWLKSVSDSFGEMTMTAALAGAVQPIAAIFISKSRYNWSDVPEVQLKESAEPEESPEAIAAKYADMPD